MRYLPVALLVAFAIFIVFFWLFGLNIWLVALLAISGFIVVLLLPQNASSDSNFGGSPIWHVFGLISDLFLLLFWWW